MDEDELKLLTRIAIALERIADSLDKDISQNEIVDDNIDVEYSNTHSLEEIDVNILIDKLKEKEITVKTYVTSHNENTSLDYIAKFMGTRYSDVKSL